LLSDEVENVAIPPLRGAVARTVVPSLKVTIPVGLTPLTVAVKVADEPGADGLGELVRVVVVGAPVSVEVMVPRPAALFWRMRTVYVPVAGSGPRLSVVEPAKPAQGEGGKPAVQFDVLNVPVACVVPSGFNTVTSAAAMTGDVTALGTPTVSVKYWPVVPGKLCHAPWPKREMALFTVLLVVTVPTTGVASVTDRVPVPAAPSWRTSTL
jgi:hypothetical protein